MSDEDPRVVWQRACEALGELPETVSFEDAGEACMRAARELLALSRRLAGVACDACRGLGDRIYPTTATWHGGAGGATPTLGVCDRCWRSGRHDQRGPDLREAARVSDALRQETRLSLALTEQRDAALSERDALRARFEALHDEVVLEASLDRKGRAYTSACVREWCASRIEATLKKEEER